MNRAQQKSDPFEDLKQGHRDLERLIRWYFPPTEHRMAIWVAWQVSGMSSLAFHRNGTPGVGLFDIWPTEVGLSDDEQWLLHNPIRNVAAAFKLWRRQGWAAWNVSPLPPQPFTEDAEVLF
jgi:hypothetical protein